MHVPIGDSAMGQQPHDVEQSHSHGGNAAAIIAGVAAVVAAVAGAAVTKVMQDPSPPPPSSGSSASAPTLPTPTPTATPASFSGEKDFEHLRVQVNGMRDRAAGSDLSHRHDLYVRVCITSPLPDAVKGQTRISWDPWQLTLADGRVIKPDHDIPVAKGMLNPARYYDTGSCPSGFIPFTVDGTDSPVAEVDYVNRQGNAATFTKH